MQAATYLHDALDAAWQKEATDVHLDPWPRDVARVRMRIRGSLQTFESLKPRDHASLAQVIARIKALSGLDVADTRHPQDGVFRYAMTEHELEIRVAFAPSVFGERGTLRLLRTPSHAPRLDDLGFCAPVRNELCDTLRGSEGLLLAIGPTGSGKTTTLHALLHELGTDKMVVTIEDPVEYVFPGAVQMQVTPGRGFDFRQGVRAALRQDPDVLLIGEIRDDVTAHVACSAAITGHMVLSSVHASDGPGALLRLRNLGIPDWLIATSVSGLLSQRLVLTNGGMRPKAEWVRADHELKHAIASRETVERLIDISARKTLFSAMKDA